MLLLQPCHLTRPAIALRRQRIDQAVCQLKLALAVGLLGFGLRAFLHGLVKLSFPEGELCREGRLPGLHLGQARIGGCQLLVGSGQLSPLGVDLSHGDDPFFFEVSSRRAS